MPWVVKSQRSRSPGTVMQTEILVTSESQT